MLICNRLLLLVIGFILFSCTQYSWEEYKPIEIESPGIVFKSLDNGFLLQTSAGAGESVISIAPVNKHIDLSYVASVKVNGELFFSSDSYDNRGSSLELSSSIIWGWGKLSYNDAESSFEIYLAKNRDNDNRVIEIQIGYGYEYVIMSITQLCDGE